MRDKFELMFEWESEAEATHFITLISSSAILGCVIGSLLGGLFIQHWGRRRTILLFNFFATLGCIVMCFESVAAICIGRLIFGFSSGVFSVAVPRMIEEIVPNHLLG